MEAAFKPAAPAAKSAPAGASRDPHPPSPRSVPTPWSSHETFSGFACCSFRLSCSALPAAREEKPGSSTATSTRRPRSAKAALDHAGEPLTASPPRRREESGSGRLPMGQCSWCSAGVRRIGRRLPSTSAPTRGWNLPATIIDTPEFAHAYTTHRPRSGSSSLLRQRFSGIEVSAARVMCSCAPPSSLPRRGQMGKAFCLARWRR
jgi:hypothetical protein